MAKRLFRYVKKDQWYDIEFKTYYMSDKNIIFVFTLLKFHYFFVIKPLSDMPRIENRKGQALIQRDTTIYYLSKYDKLLKSKY